MDGDSVQLVLHFLCMGEDYRRDIAMDGDVRLTVVSQPTHSAFQVPMVSPDKLQAEESDVPAVLPVGSGTTTGQ